MDYATQSPDRKAATHQHVRAPFTLFGPNSTCRAKLQPGHGSHKERYECDEIG